MNTDRLREKIRDIRKAYSFIPGETSLEEIDHYLTPVSAVVGISEGDIVELVNGPFKGERARVQHIDEGKEEITVELVEAMVPIPVTVKGDSVRVIDKER
jgi:transcriptional antiterminator NusG